MRVLSSADLLALWERGCRLHPVDRALVALQAGFPEIPYEALAEWSLGRCNQVLAELRCGCFGARLAAWTGCPHCGEKLEFQLDARALAQTQSPIQGSVTVMGESFRLPTSRDMARLVDETDPLLAAAHLLEACRLGEGQPRTWSQQDIDDIGEQMAAADPMAETRVTLDCPACGKQWDDTLDIAAFLWTEVASRARRLLRDVHAIASAYGWTENEILSLSDGRRALYLEMIDA